MALHHLLLLQLVVVVLSLPYVCTGDTGNGGGPSRLEEKDPELSMIVGSSEVTALIVSSFGGDVVVTLDGRSLP